jgi:hypothetical protein
LGKTDLDGLKKEVTSFSDTFLTAHTNTTNINSMWNDFKSGCLDIMNSCVVIADARYWFASI